MTKLAGKCHGKVQLNGKQTEKSLKVQGESIVAIGYPLL